MDEDEYFRRLMGSDGVAPLGEDRRSVDRPGPRRSEPPHSPEAQQSPEAPPSPEAEDEDDRRLFEAAMRDLEARPIDPASPAVGPQSREAVEDMEESDRQLFEAAMRELETASLDAMPIDVEPLDPKPARGPRRVRPRKKDLEADERIDLHRCTVEQAEKLLTRAMETASRSRSRTLLVITGKGHHSPGGVPVLRRRVEEWIQRHGRRYGVETYSEAPRALGGRGAFMLYLRRSSGRD